jgi:hypothetical protein
MNELIKRLKEQAKEYASKFAYAQAIGQPGYEEKFSEKFAELIIRECASYINERTSDWDADLRWVFNDGSGDMAVDVTDLLNKHFGVE